ncbi:MAG: hypothetical protein AAF715_05250 [Myxococcota bacterium]
MAAESIASQTAPSGGLAAGGGGGSDGDDGAPSSGVPAEGAAVGDPRRAGGALLLVGLATLAAVASLLSRGLAPALPGVWLGVESAIRNTKLVGALASQLLAVCSSALVIALVVTVVKADRPGFLRAMSVGVGVLTVLAVMIASAVPLPDPSLLVLATGVGLLAALSAVRSARSVAVRAPAVVVLLLAGAGVMRVGVILLSHVAFDWMSGGAADAARVLVTLSAVPVMVAVVFALVWMIRAPSARPQMLRWVALMGLTAGLGLVVALAQLGEDPEAGGVPLLVARTLHELGFRPRPLGPALLFNALVALRWLTAAALLVAVPRASGLAACVALALVAGGHLEVPLYAAGMVVSSMVLTLHADHTLDPNRR